MSQKISIFLLIMSIFLTSCVDESDVATHTPQPLLLTPTSMPSPVSTQTLTEFEVIDNEMQAKYGRTHHGCTSDAGDPMPPDANCRKYLWTKPVATAQWNALFPQTNFYLIRFDIMVGCSGMTTCSMEDYFLIAQQGSNRYQVNTFDKLLEANGIVITDENRQLVAEAAILMWLEEFTQTGIPFTDWEEGASSEASVSTNYHVKVELQNGMLQFGLLYGEHCFGGFAVIGIEVIESDNSLYGIISTNDKDDDVWWRCY